MPRTQLQCFTLVLLLLLCVATLGSPAPIVYTLGAPISEPHAIAVDERGRLLVMDWARTAVMRFDLNGHLDKIVPDGDAITTCGTSAARNCIYSVSGGRVLLGPLSGRGKDLRLVNMETSESTDIAMPDKYAYWIAASDAGDYCVQNSQIDGLQTFSADGKLKASWHCPHLHSFSIGPDGKVYANEYNTSNIYVYSPDGKLLNQFDVKTLIPPTSGGGLWRVVADRNGDVYAFFGGGDVVRISPDCKTGRIICRCLPRHSAIQGGGGCTMPDFTVRNGLIYTLILASKTSEVQVITPDGQCVAVYESPVLKLNMPGSIAVQPDGSYAVQQCAGRRCVSVFNPDDSYAGDLGVDICKSVAPSRSGGFYTANGYRLEYYCAPGKPAKQVLDHTVETKQLGRTAQTIMPIVTESAEHLAVDPVSGDPWCLAYGYPKCRFIAFGSDDSVSKRIYLGLNNMEQMGEFAVDLAGCMYVSRAWTSDIVKYDSEGKQIATLGKKGSGIGQLLYNNGIALDKAGRVYVADTGNSRIQVFSPNGQPLGVWGSRGSGEGQLDRPLGVAIGPKETLWITDTCNDRIVRVPLADFWKQISKTPVAEPVRQVAAVVPAPTAGKTIASGVVIAGTEDFTDTVYLESQDRSWGVCVKLPAGVALARGEYCRLAGTFSQSSHVFTAEPLERFGKTQTPGPLGMANLYVGDGYQSLDRADLSNLCLLVRTWGRVVSVNAGNHVFTINDGSIAGEGTGLAVFVGSLHKPVAKLPNAGDYVAVTGVSTTWVWPDGSHTPAVRVRDDADIQVL